jgi:hypothetical protein
MFKEILYRRIVPAVGTPRHGGRDGILLCKDKIRLRSVLLPLVTVEDQFRSDLFFLCSLLNGLVDQGLRVLPSKCVRDNETIEQILDGGKIPSALERWNVSDIGHSFLVRSGSGEIVIVHILITMVSAQFGCFSVVFTFSDYRVNIQLVH